MDYCVFIIIAIIFYFVAYRVGIKKHIYLINSIDNEDAIKIKGNTKLHKFFGIFYLILGIISSIGAYITYKFGALGFGIASIILLSLFFISILAAIKLYFSITN